MKIKEITRRLIVDILYAALEDGDVGFLKNAYDELKLHDNKRIRKMRKNWNKISSKAVNTVYEDIIGIIVEEICQKANRGLLDDLMGYYLKRFPDVQERIDDFGDDIEGLLDHQTSIYPFVQERDEDEGEYRISAINDNFSESGSDYADFLKRSLILLYAITTCKDNSTGAHTYIRKIQEQMFANYKDEKFLFYDRQQKIANRIQWVKIIEGDSCYFTRFKTLFIQDMRRLFSQVYDIAPEKMEEYILDEIIGMGGELHEYKNTLYKLNPIGIREMMDSICKKLHVNTLEILDSANREKYIRTIKEIFEKWCRNEMANIGYDYNYDLGTGINEPVGIDELDLERCVSEVAAAFLFQCYVEIQQGIWDEYYKNFSFDSKAEVMEELYEKCSRLNDENIQYRKKIQSYEEADSLRKKQQNKKAKELDKQYTEKVALLEKQIGEQALLQENMREYIRLVEAAGDKAIKAEEADYVKIFNHKIVFVGGAPETKSRLKAVFRTAAFIKDENMPVPAKADLIVLLAGNTDHALYYKYIGAAREKRIKVIYCNKTEIESVTAQVCNSL